MKMESKYDGGKCVKRKDQKNHQWLEKERERERERRTHAHQ